MQLLPRMNVMLDSILVALSTIQERVDSNNIENKDWLPTVGFEYNTLSFVDRSFHRLTKSGLMKALLFKVTFTVWYYAFFLVCCGCDAFCIVSVNIQYQTSIYTLCCVAGIHGGRG